MSTKEPADVPLAVPVETPAPSSALVARSSAPTIEGQVVPAVAQRPSLGRRRWFWPLAVAAVALAAAGAGVWFFVPPVVAVTSPVRGPAVEAVYSSGTVEAPVLIAVAARVSGRIAEVAVEEGSSVGRGELLVRLEDDDLQETVRQFVALELFAQQQFDRAARLLERGTLAQSAYDRAQSDLQAAKAVRARAEAEASQLRLTAPADGQVVRRDGEVGQLIPANQPILWLTRNEPLRIVGSVDEEDVARVLVGQPVLIRADAFPGQTFRGRVQSITPMGDAVARSYRVRIELTEPAPLLIGMTAEINIVTREDQNALLVPSGAIDQGRIWRVVDGRLSATPVTVGVRGAERIEVTAGVSPEDQIVVEPDASFREGDRVRTRPAETR